MQIFVSKSFPANKLLNLSPEAQARGVVTVSTGNHGRAVSYVAGQMGMQATVCISERVPANKVAALKQLGAEVVIHGNVSVPFIVPGSPGESLMYQLMTTRGEGPRDQMPPLASRVVDQPNMRVIFDWIAAMEQ